MQTYNSIPFWKNSQMAVTRFLDRMEFVLEITYTSKHVNVSVNYNLELECIEDILLDNQVSVFRYYQNKGMLYEIHEHLNTTDFSQLLVPEFAK